MAKFTVTPEELPEVLERIKEATAVAIEQVPYFLEGETRAMVEAMGEMAQAGALPASPPLSPITIQLKAGAKFAYDSGGLWEKIRISREEDGEDVLIAAWPQGATKARAAAGDPRTLESHTFGGGGHSTPLPYTELLRLFEEGHVFQGYARLKMLAYLAVALGEIGVVLPKKSKTGTIVFPRRDLVKDDMLEPMAELLGKRITQFIKETSRSILE